MKILLISLVFLFVACATQEHSTQTSHVDDKKKDKKEKTADRYPTSTIFEQARPSR